MPLGTVKSRVRLALPRLRLLMARDPRVNHRAAGTPGVVNKDREQQTDDSLPEAAVPLDEFAESHTSHDVRIEGRTARATDELDEQPTPDKTVQEPPD